MIRNDWTLEEIQEIYNMPFLELVYRAATVHRTFNESNEVQVCTLLSIKTGGVRKIVPIVPRLPVTIQM